MGLTAADIVAVADRVIEKVACPEWGGEVFVRSLSTAEAFQLERSIRGLEDMPTIMIAQFAAFACDEAGNALFASAEDAKPLIDKKMAVLRRVNEAGMGLNKMGSLEAEKQKS